MKATDLPLLRSVSRPTLSPDGRRAVVAVTRPDPAADAYLGQLWSVPLGEPGPPRRITRGFRDTAPRFSPDGRLLAFLRSGPATPAQLYLVDAAGGEPVRATDATLGVTEFVWSPDGTRLAFVTRVPEQGRYGTVEGLDAGAEPARRVGTLRYRANGLGYTIDQHAHIFLVDAPDVWAEPVVQPAPTIAGVPDPVPEVPGAVQLTHGDFDHGTLSFGPDGRTLAFVSARHPHHDEDLRSAVYLLDLETPGAEPVDVTSGHGSWSVLAVEHGLEHGLGGAIFFLAQELGPSGRDFVARNASLFVIDREGAVPRILTDPEIVDLGEADSSITPVSADVSSGAVLVQNRTRGSVQLLRIDADGTTTPLTAGGIEVTGVAVAGETIAVSYADATTTGDVALVTGAPGSALRPLTDFSAPLRAAGILQPLELVVTGRDGYPIHGWLVLPPGDGPHPVLLDIHGGPFAQYSVHAFDEAQVYADAGYAVLLCNPRGSAGYGQGHGRAIRQKMGTVDLDDVLDFLDAAVREHPSLDGDRTGIMGGSYGGYLTAWTIAHDHRFAAAIVERGYLDPEAFVGTSDIGSYFSDEYAGTDPVRLREQSPQAVVGEVRTPTLVIHSADDLRCPLAQAERYYAALKRGGADAELLVFPGENHELSRSGRPRHRLERFEAILDWWARYLPSTVNSTPMT